MGMHYTLDDIGESLSWRQLIAYTRNPPKNSVYLRTALKAFEDQQQAQRQDEQKMHFGSDSMTIADYEARWAAASANDEKSEPTP